MTQQGCPRQTSGLGEQVGLLVGGNEGGCSPEKGPGQTLVPPSGLFRPSCCGLGRQR